ncbi:MAG: hypothetical protein WC159_02015 [Sphaerochaetaceae bacterium]
MSLFLDGMQGVMLRFIVKRSRWGNSHSTTWISSRKKEKGLVLPMTLFLRNYYQQRIHTGSKKMDVASIFETIMILCFGLSWPLSIVRSYRSRSTKGKSLMFMCFIVVGYLCGLISKIISHTYNLAFYFYFPNIILVCADIALYFRNKTIEKNERVK